MSVVEDAAFVGRKNQPLKLNIHCFSPCMLTYYIYTLSLRPTPLFNWLQHQQCLWKLYSVLAVWLSLSNRMLSVGLIEFLHHQPVEPLNNACHSIHTHRTQWNSLWKQQWKAPSSQSHLSQSWDQTLDRLLVTVILGWFGRLMSRSPLVNPFLCFSLTRCVYTAGWWLERSPPPPSTLSLSSCSALCPPALFRDIPSCPFCCHLHGSTTEKCQ